MTSDADDTILVIRVVRMVAEHCGEKAEDEPTTKRRMMQASLAVSLLDNSCNGHRGDILAVVADILDNAPSELLEIRSQ